MSDGKEYISQPDEMGSVHIAGEVLAVIAAAAALEVEGVSSLSAHFGGEIAELTGKKVLSKGIHLQVVETNVRISISLLIEYGYAIPEVARNVQQAVQTAVANTSGLTVESVNVHVAGISFPKEKRSG